MKMPTDPKWRESQLQAMLALGDAPQDAERVLAAMEQLSPDDPTVLPDSEAFAAMFGQVTPDDVRDATADWMVRARPEWKRLLTAMAKVSEFNPHHDALGRFAAGSAAVGLSYHALGRIGTQGRANVTSVRDALERLQTVKTPDSDWSYPVRQGDKLRGHLIGTDGIVKTVVGAWYKAEKLPPALAEADMTEGTIDVSRSIAWHLDRLTDAEAARFCDEANLAPMTANEFRRQWRGDTWDDLALLIYIRREDEPSGE